MKKDYDETNRILSFNSPKRNPINTNKQQINYGIIVSFTSGISKHSVFDIETIDDKHIIFISNPNNKFSNEQIYNEISLSIRIINLLSVRSYNSTIKIDKDKIAECTEKFRNIIVLVTTKVVEW